MANQLALETTNKKLKTSVLACLDVKLQSQSPQPLIMSDSQPDSAFLAPEDGSRYGFNGMERDDEWNGVGNSYDFGVRILDVRIGRWLAVDLKDELYPIFCSYGAFGNYTMFFVNPTEDENPNWTNEQIKERRYRTKAINKHFYEREYLSLL